MPSWIDGHCHLAESRLDSTRAAILARSLAAGVSIYVQGGIDPGDWKRQEDIAATYPGRIIPCFGLHPWWVAALEKEEPLHAALQALNQALPRARAIGELGLDFGKRFGPETHALQRLAFERQLRLGSLHRKPLVLHIVRAHPEALAMLEAHGAPLAGGIVHSFSGSQEVARRYLALGLCMSIGPRVLGNGAETLKRAVATIPGDRLTLETDSPDQADEPSRIVEIAAAVALARKESAARVLEKSRENLSRIFGI